MSQATIAQSACIVSLGARTPVGLRALPAAAAVRAGVSRIREHPFMVDKAGDPLRLALDWTLDVHDRNERLFVLSSHALDEALARIAACRQPELPVYVSLPEYGPYFSEAEAQALCMRLSRHVARHVATRCMPVPKGNAAFFVALEQALTNIADGAAPCCVVGGVDSFLDAGLLAALDEGGRIMSASNRWGFPPGEGAAMLAVSSAAFAQRHGLQPLAWIASLATSVEDNHMHTKTVCTGEVLAQVLGQAAQRGGAPITKQYCDINGERYREHEFSYAILRVPAQTFVNAVDYIAPADCWGNTGAGTGALLALLPIVSHLRGFSPGARPMVWAGSENGQRGAMVLSFREEVSGCRALQ